MKKILLIIMAVLLIVSFSMIGVGCKKGEPVETTVSTGTTAAGETTKAVETTAAEEAPAEKITLTYWNQWGAPYQREVTIAQIKGFEAENPNIKIEERILPNATAEELMRVAMSSSEPPDVFGEENPYDLFHWARLGLVGDLTEFYTSNIERFPEGAKNWEFADGKYWAIPQTICDVPFILYNKDILSKYNIDASNIKTFDDFFAASDILKANGIVPIALANKIGVHGVHWFAMFLSKIVSIDDINGVFFRTEKDQTPKWTDPGFVKAAKLLKRLHDDGYIQPGGEMLEDKAETAAFATGKAAFREGNSYFLLTQPPEELNWGYFPIPNMPGEPGSEQLQIINTYLGGYAYSKESKHPEAALKFIEFLSRPEQSRLWYTKGKLLPGINGAIDLSEITEPYLRDCLKASQETKGHVPFLELWINPEAGAGAMDQGSTAVMLGQITVEKWLQNIEDAQQLVLK